MKIEFDGFDKKISGLIRDIGRAADSRQVQAYLVGGVVRDILLGKKNLDLDIVVQGNAVALAKAVAEKYKARIIFYEQFGTATVSLSDEWAVDFAMARKEVYAHPGALPRVSFGNIQDDLYRRDFTINAMAASLNAENFGEIIDLYGGKADLFKGRIRILHPGSFMDDPTRILRAVRFEQRFGFRIEKGTAVLMKKALARKIYNKVRPPRYFEEFRKILREPSPRRSLARLNQLGGLAFLGAGYRYPDSVMSALEKNIRLLKGSQLYSDASWGHVYLRGLFSGLPVKARSTASRRLGLTRTETAMAIFPDEKMAEIMKELNRRGLPPSRVYRILHRLPEGIIYFIRARSSGMIGASYIDLFLEKLRHMCLRITGNDVKTTIPAAQGKEIGWILQTVLNQKLDGTIKTLRQERQALKALKR